jgi:zinc protease
MNALKSTLAAFLLLAACGPKAPSSSLALPPPPPATAEPEAAPPAAAPAQPAPPELAFPAEDFRAKPPESGAPRPFDAPDIARYKLKNGIEVYHVERHELPTVSMDIVFPGGVVNDPTGKEGMATMCMGLMSEGTEKLDKIAFNEALADIASSISSYATQDQQGVSMDTLTRHLDKTLELWADTILHPGMRKDELDRSVKRRLESLKQQRGSVAGVYGRLFGSVAHGEKHPYGRVVTETSTQAVAIEDCKKYVADYTKPAGAKLYVVGDITRPQLEEKLGKALAGWKGTPKKSVVAPKAAPRKGRIFFVDVPGAPQSQVALLHLGPPRKAKDYFSTYLMSSILGGSFSSRINMNIREAKGWAYGARGGFGYNRAYSVFSAGGSIVADKTKDAILEIVKEIRGMRDADAADDEVAREKDGAIQALPSLFATRRGVLGSYRELIYYGLPLDYYDHYVKNVQSVDKGAVKKAATSHLKVSDLRLFVVGDGQTVLPMLKELQAQKVLGDGELVILDADGRVKAL